MRHDDWTDDDERYPTGATAAWAFLVLIGAVLAAAGAIIWWLWP